jgi:hypothetical protein
MNLPFWLVFVAVVPPLLLGVWYEFRAARLSRFDAIGMFVAFLYGMTVEALALHHTRDYNYANLWLMFGSPPNWVPYTIGVCWASIMYVVMRTSDALELPWWQRPLFDGAAAMTLDLMLDPVMSSTKMVAASNFPCMDTIARPIGGLGLWTWCVPPAAHMPLWFTVPVDNFLGWCAVITMFSLMVRLGYRYWNPDARGPLAQFAMLLLLAALAIGGCALIGPTEMWLSTGPAWLAYASLGTLVAVPFVMVAAQAGKLNFHNPFPTPRVVWPAYAYTCWGSLFFIMRLDDGDWPGAAYLMVGTILVGILVFMLPYLGTIRQGRAKT